jgi:hypothetical protein
MAPSERIRRHLQSHAVAYVALFVALSGTAIALPGKNKVKQNDIARGAVVGKAIAPHTVRKTKIRAGAVTTNKLLDGAITAPKLAEDSVTGQAIAQGSINGGKIANGAIDSTKVDNGSLLAEDFGPGQISDAFLFDDATGPQTFTIQRPGRVYVTATVVVLCENPPCNDGYAVVIDGAIVPGAELVVPAEMVVAQLTLVGLTGQLTAGPHRIELISSTPSADEVVNLAGVLIQ